MIELPNKRPETRKFNRVQAMAGAVVVTSLGFEARVVCFDRMGAHTGNTGIVALVKRRTNYEEAFMFDRDGKDAGNMGALGDLCMAEVIRVEGKAIFNGETVYSDLGEPYVVYFENFPPVGKRDADRFRLNPPPIQFEGQPLHFTDKIWSRQSSNEPWVLVNCSDNWSDKPGIAETHFGAIRRNEGRQMVLHCYTRKSPHSTMLEGKELKIGDVLWYTHPTSKGASIVVHEKTIENFINGVTKHSVFTRIQPLKIENWQAKAHLRDAPEAAAIFVGGVFPSKEKCEFEKDRIPQEYRYLSSEKVSEYYA